jgi:hypothetical protein
MPDTTQSNETRSKEAESMKTKISPVAAGIAIVIALVLCVLLYIRANSGLGPNQEPPADSYKPTYGSGEGAGPNNRGKRPPAR